jgi:transcriptional regulator with XRE-family HTH domain
VSLDLAKIGTQIAGGRKAADLSQTDLAMRAKVSRATINALENGRAGDIGFSKLNRILAVIGLELELRACSSQRPTLDELLKDNEDD